jgi:hypothetical protein
MNGYMKLFLEINDIPDKARVLTTAKARQL